MHDFENTHNLQGATLSQRARIFLAETLRIGPLFTRAAVWGELDDRLNGSLSESPVTPSELAYFEDSLSEETSEEARYALLAQPIPSDKDISSENQRVWFDVIPGLTEYPIVRGIAKIARSISPPNKARWEHVGDLGSGTGAVGAAFLKDETNLSSPTERLTLIDRVPSLLAVAAKRYGSGMEYVEGDVTNLPFPDQTFDLLLSGGLVYSLGKGSQDAYFSEVSRLLQPGGVYIDGDYTERYLHDEPNVGLFHLSYLIKWYLSPMEGMGNPLRGINQEEYFKKFGLNLSQQSYLDEVSGRQVIIRVLQKTS